MLYNNTIKETHNHLLTYLSVQQNVDDWIVQSSTLGEEGWCCHEYRSKLNSLIGKDVPSHSGIGHPAHEEGDHHDYDHACHLLLCSLRGF